MNTMMAAVQTNFDLGAATEAAASGDVSFSVDDSSTGREYHHREETQEEQREVIAKKESQQVFRLKLLVLLILVLFAIMTALAVYFYIDYVETDQFEDDFKDDGFKVLEAFGSSLDKTFGAMDSLAVAIVSYARATNQTWPNVTIPDFAYRAANVLELSDAFVLSTVPVVTNETRLGWEAYSGSDALDWVDQTLAAQETWPSYYGPRNQSWEAHNVIHGDFGDIPYNTTRIMLPTWQSFPLVMDGWPPANWDWYSVLFKDAMTALLDRSTAVVTEPYLLPTPDDPIAHEETQLWAEWYRNFLQPDEEPFEPAADIYYPIIDSLDRVGHDGEEEESPVGMIAASVYWRNFIRDILPSGSKGIVVIFDNNCTEPFTYQVDGPMQTYLGTGDLHDRKYDHLGLHSSLTDLNKYSVRDSKYTGAPLDELFCPLSLHVYPSSDMQEQYSTNNGIIFAVSAVGIFVFTSLVFVLYDFYVERRQKLVMNKAERSSAIVSSLFPSTVRDRLEVPTVKAPPEKNPFKRNNGKLDHLHVESDEVSPLVGPPIANLYPETTILFADLVGFTHWSSTREPEQVFTLLETLYGAFDAVARRRGVFKVETIGDCYVAVAGLPNPRKDHAVVMARFARDCMTELRLQLGELEKKLGQGTTDLKLRCGLNSGPVTAGVLRGEKARFQLFGDSMNTAARMESNSLPNEIMVSQSTSDQLRDHGKGHWLTPREDLVSAKGKGLMQCYWCRPKSGGSSCTSTSFASDKDADDDENDKGKLLEFDNQLKIMPSSGKSNVIVQEQQLAETAEQSIDEETLGDRNSMEHGDRIDL